MGTHLSHFGAFEAETDGTRLRKVSPWSQDPDPYPIIDNIASSQHHPTRVLRPAVRRSWLEHGPESDARESRGEDAFVEVSWAEAFELVGTELERVYRTYGSSAVYGGSYGWASAGRFHHAQSQLHRFLGVLGGYVSRRGDYSHGCSAILLPHIVGEVTDLIAHSTSWDSIVEHTELLIAFGGMSAKNSAIASGGIAKHSVRQRAQQARERGCRFVSVSPIADDTFAEAAAAWCPIRPATDAALMLALAYELERTDRVDRAFLEQYTTGYPKLRAYLLGEQDGQPKSPEWAATITELPAERIRALAAEMASKRTMISLSWSLQRQQHGEQPIWLGITLAAMLGQIGLPGGGFAHGYGTAANVGQPARVASAPSFPNNGNAESAFIPVARIADMLLHPGEPYEFNGEQRTYPDIKLVYWCGGNPFHHAQDLAKVRRGFRRPDTVIVHEQFWTATARHADIVLPATMTIERDDFGAGRNDQIFMPMPALTRPAGEAKDDYDIFAAVADRLGHGEEFTEGRTTQGWLRHLYCEWRDNLAARGHEVVAFEEFWGREYIEIPVTNTDQVLLEDFRVDPDAHPLPTPSGKLEIHSDTIAGFDYEDCPGHPVWLEPEDWLGNETSQYRLHLIANQPKTRLHSQLDVGAHSQASKIGGREPVRMHPADAADRNLESGQVVRLYNDLGSCLAGLQVSDAIKPGTVQLSTGAWYDPDPSDPSFCRHGNPNVLVSDQPTSTLTQATTGQHALIEVERYELPLPELTVNMPPEFVAAVR